MAVLLLTLPCGRVVRVVLGRPLRPHHQQRHRRVHHDPILRLREQGDGIFIREIAVVDDVDAVLDGELDVKGAAAVRCDLQPERLSPTHARSMRASEQQSRGREGGVVNRTWATWTAVATSSSVIVV